MTSITILVAEYDQQVRKCIGAIVRRSGYRVIEAKNGADAVRLTGENQVDLLIADYEMPGLTGSEVISQLRAAGSTTRYLMISAGDYDGQLNPPVPFLPKPFVAADLLQKLREILAA